jgi:predicted deacetylase
MPEPSANPTGLCLVLHDVAPSTWKYYADFVAAVDGLGKIPLIRLPDFRPEPAPTLVWSARSGWRRALSRQWNDGLLRRQRSASLLRLGVHPLDLRHGPVYRYWLQTLQRLLDSRSPCTKSAWLERAA